MKVGIIGLGGVGKAFIKLLLNKREVLLRRDINLEVNFIMNSKSIIYDENGIDLESLVKFMQVEKDLSKYTCGGYLNNIDYLNLIKKYKVDFLIEMTPTNMETGEPGLTYIREALKNRINVVTANKGPILLAYKDLKNLATENNVKLGIGCTSGGALPTINGGLMDMAGAEIISIEGILNGTTNFILDCMLDENLSYKEALAMAQRMGISETKFQLDVEGWDTAIKLIIITNAVMNKDKTLRDIYIQGITDVTVSQIKKAKENGERYKLIARAIKKNGDLEMTVKPERIDKSHIFYNVNGKNKSILYKSDTLGEIAIMGGASDVNAAAASILRDIINIHQSRI